jgi:hypothetical protein
LIACEKRPRNSPNTTTANAAMIASLTLVDEVSRAFSPAIR